MTQPLHAAATSTDPFRAVELLIDADDTAACVAQLNARHNLAAGVAVCHPSPGVATLPVLGEDVLVALGKRPGGPAVEGVSRRAWELAGLWLRAERVEHLVVLRSHQLPASRWRDLVELTAAAGTRLWLVAHQAALGDGHRAALIGPGAASIATTPGRPWRVALSMLPASVATGWAFPEVPDVEFPLFRAAARRLLDPPGFARVDAVYRTTLADARAEAHRWTRPGTVPLSIGPRQAAAVLQRHTIDATTAAEVLTRVQAVQAGLFTAGLFLQLPCHRTEPRLDPTLVERLRGLCSPAAAAAVTLWLATGMGVDELRGLRLRDLHDTGPDQHLAVGGTLYRVPARAAGLLRAAVIERRTLLAAEPPGHDGDASEGPYLFTGAAPGSAAAQGPQLRFLERAAAHAGVTSMPPSFPGVAIHDLRGTS